MDDINLREVANAIIKEFPQLADDIDDAYKTMNKCIKDGESKIEEQDLFYWYIHKLKKNEIKEKK
jgi:hypothetical protein